MMSEADGNCHASCSDSVFCFLHLCQYLSFHSFFSSTHLSILVLFHLSHFPFFSSLLSSSLTTSVSSSAVSRLSPSIISFFNLLSLHITKPFLCTHSIFFIPPPVSKPFSLSSLPSLSVLSSIFLWHFPACCCLPVFGSLWWAKTNSAEKINPDPQPVYSAEAQELNCILYNLACGGVGK